MKLITVKNSMLRGTVDIPKIRGTNEGDFYYGAFFLVAGAIGNDIICRGLSRKSSCANAQIIDIIENSGGKIIQTNEGISAKMSAVMHGVEVDASKIADIIPAVAVLCAFLKGESHIFVAAELRRKGDVLRGVAAELTHLGIFTEMTSDGLWISGGQVLKSDGAYAWNSSSLAAALTIAASRSEGEMRLIGTENTDGRYKMFMKIYSQLSRGDLK